MLTLSFVGLASNGTLSANLQAVLLSKILLHERQYRDKDDIRVFVLGAPKVAMAFGQLIGDSDEWIKIKQVSHGESLPQEKYDLIYFNDDQLLPEVLAYAKKHHIVMATGNIKLVPRGVTLGVGIDRGKPHFYLNLRASFAADLQWEQRVLSIVKVFR